MLRTTFVSVTLFAVASALQLDTNTEAGPKGRSQFDEAVSRLAIEEGKVANSAVMDKVAQSAPTGFEKAAIMHAKDGRQLNAAGKATALKNNSLENPPPAPAISSLGKKK